MSQHELQCCQDGARVLTVGMGLQAVALTAIAPGPQWNPGQGSALSHAEQALEQLKSALAADTSQPKHRRSTVPLANMGLLLLSAKLGPGATQLPPAVASLRQLVARQPDSPQAHHALAAALHRQVRDTDIHCGYRYSLYDDPQRITTQLTRMPAP
jgi:tetratricopeptide (TPR) repeat protein